jgi:hypothetical protein
MLQIEKKDMMAHDISPSTGFDEFADSNPAEK